MSLQLLASSNAALHLSYHSIHLSIQSSGTRIVLSVKLFSRILSNTDQHIVALEGVAERKQARSPQHPAVKTFSSKLSIFVLKA
jgi:hypothetical protein